MIPKMSLLIIFLLALSIMLNIFFNKPENYTSDFAHISYFQLVIPSIILLMLFGWLFVKSSIEDPTGIGDANIPANISIFVLHTLFLLFIVSAKDNINLFIKSYISIVFLMSIFGLLATILLSTGLINPAEHYINLNELTHGSFVRDEKIEGSYVFPYFFGLILTGDGLFDFAGFQFYRISGWAHEPTSATLFVAPAIIMLIHSNIVENFYYRFGALLAIILFWLAAMAIGSFVAFFLLYSAVLLLHMFIKIFPKKISITLLLIMIVALPVMVYFSELISDSSILTSKFDFESETMGIAIRELTWFVPHDGKTTYFYLTHLFMWIIIGISLVVSLYGVINTKFPNPYALTLLYLVIHSMKGSQESVFVLTFLYFWLYLAIFNVFFDKKESSI
jgi:hypothetical protein